MTNEVRFFSNDIAGKLRDGVYELPEGSTVAALMEAAFCEAGLDVPVNRRTDFVFIYNNSPAQADTCLQDGGKLRVLYKISGG